MGFLLHIMLANIGNATTYGTLYSIVEMTDLAHDVISGEVQKLEYQLEDGLIVTTVTVDIKHNYVGNKQKEFSFNIPGGTLDGITLSVPGAPTFSVGQDVLLFLDHKQVVGFGQGAYAVGQNGLANRTFEGADVPATANTSANSLDPDRDLPDESEARSCLEVKVWDDYDENWTLRSVEVDHLADGEFKSYPLTLLQGLKYEFLSCTDEKADAIELALYNMEGEQLTVKYSEGREGFLEFNSDKTQTVILSVQVEVDNPDTKQVGTSVGVLYK